MVNNPQIFSKITRAQLIDDAIVLAKQGQLDFSRALEIPLSLLHQGGLEELTGADVGMFERAMRAVADVHDCIRGSKLERDMLVSDKCFILKGDAEKASNQLCSRIT